MSEVRIHFEGRYLGIHERSQWEYATRTNASAVAVLVPITDSDRLILVEQYRIPVQSQVIELPAGLVGDQGDADEPVHLAAGRELEEETGYRAGRLTRLLACPSSAGLTDEMITFFLAEQLQRVGSGGGDDSEDIVVHEIPRLEVGVWLMRQLAEGKMIDPKIYTALYWLQRRAEGKPVMPA